MRTARLLGVVLALALSGCVRVMPVQVPAATGGPPPAVLDQLALVVPLPEGVGTYVTQPWHRARLTIGRHDGSIPEVTQTFVAGTTGLRALGKLPPLEPGSGYWLRVELVQDQADGGERIVGRGVAGGDEDEGLDLAPGANMARLAVKPTLAGSYVALAPVRPLPADDDEDWSPRWERDAFEPDERPTLVDWLSDEDEPAGEAEPESDDGDADHGLDAGEMIGDPLDDFAFREHVERSPRR